MCGVHVAVREGAVSFSVILQVAVLMKQKEAEE